jgi:LAS superfamily LD-carboxypeptidase LdcB
MKPLRKEDYVILLFIGCILAILFSATHIVVQMIYLYGENAELKKNLALNQDVLSNLQKNNFLLKYHLISTQENLKNEKQTNENFQNQIEGINSAVNVLEKLTKTDTELLKKYSRVYFLNENYVPEKLSTLEPKYLLELSKETRVHTDVLPFLKALLDNASSSGNSLLVASAYRSFEDQKSIKSQYKVTYGTGANKFSADQGYSEHQLGTTVDLTTPKLENLFSQFDKTDEYKWLLLNAHKFGFVLSYPKENTYYIFEPWHWRFVGIMLATKIYNEKTYFYAVDQREVNQYLVNVFDL